MELYICEPNQYLQPVPVAVIDTFKSLIWTKRYFNCGDFELYTGANADLLPFLVKDNYIMRDDDDSIMLIEDIRIQTDAESGNYFIITGRSIESILKRRVFQHPKTVKTSDYINNAIYSLFNFFTGNRALSIIVVDQLHKVPGSVNAQFTGVTLFDAIKSILQPLGLWFKLSVGTNLNVLVLSIIERGKVDVIFSPEFDNLVNSNYVAESQELANYAFVAGEGDGSSRIVYGTQTDGTSVQHNTGIKLREIYVDARDISSNDGEISTPEYIELLKQRGITKLIEEHSTKEMFEAEVNAIMPFEYKKDWDLGDIVTVTNQYGVTAEPRIVEVIECWDDTGYTVIPTFDALEVQ